jgi:hypothetical protein
MYDMERFFNKIIDELTIDKPFALQWHEWDEWETKMRTERPFAYWLNETMPDFFRSIYKSTTKPFNDLRYAIRVRVFDRYHVIPTGLKPGYSDADTRMMHGLFTLLVDLVEVEKAWMHVVFDAEARKKYKHPWWSLGWTRFKAFRDPAAGLAHLAWEMTLDDPNLPETERSTHQAVAAREICELYHWWKDVRPNRPDTHDASGWTEYCRDREAAGKHVLDFRKESEEDELRCRTALDLSRKIEAEQEQEDDDMLIRLVKIRRSLWT